MGQVTIPKAICAMYIYVIMRQLMATVSIVQWDKVKNTVYLQAMQIALRIRVVSLMQVMTAFQVMPPVNFNWQA